MREQKKKKKKEKIPYCEDNWTHHHESGDAMSMDLTENPHQGHCQQMPHKRTRTPPISLLMESLLLLFCSLLLLEGSQGEEEELCDTPCQQGRKVHLLQQL